MLNQERIASSPSGFYDESMRLKDKRIIITGGYRGLGLATTRACIQEGARVAVCGRHIEHLRKLESLFGSCGEKFFWYQCDITDPLEVSNFVKKTLYEFGGIDVLVNNASIYGTQAKLRDYPAATFQEVLDVNVIGTFHMIQTVLKGVLGKEGAPSTPTNLKIVNVSSSVIARNEKIGSAYHVSKIALEGLSSMVSREYGEFGVNTNIVDPYGIRQEPTSPFHDPDMNTENSLSAEDIQDIFVYLASAESNGINGRTFNAIEWCRHNSSKVSAAGERL